MSTSFGYMETAIGLIEKIEKEQYDHLVAAARLMADTICSVSGAAVFSNTMRSTMPVMKWVSLSRRTF